MTNNKSRPNNGASTITGTRQRPPQMFIYPHRLEPMTAAPMMVIYSIAGAVTATAP